MPTEPAAAAVPAAAFCADGAPATAEQSDPAAAVSSVTAPTVDLLVLAGGRGSRLGGALKPAVDVAGRTLLARVLDARVLVRRTVVVAPDAARPAAGPADTPASRDTPGNPLIWALEDPPFGGPVAGIAAGLAALAADPPADWILLLACDLPWAADAARHLLTHLADPTLPPTLDGIYLVDDTGRDQWLVGLYRAGALRAGSERLGPAVHGASVRQLLAGRDLHGLPDPSGSGVDVDTWQDVTLTTERLRTERLAADGPAPTRSSAADPAPDGPAPDGPAPAAPAPDVPAPAAPAPARALPDPHPSRPQPPRSDTP